MLVGFGEGVGEGFGEGVGEGVGGFVGVGVGVGGQWAVLQFGVTREEAASTGIILLTTKNRPVKSIHKATKVINIMVLLLRLSILFGITNSFKLINIHAHQVIRKYAFS